MFSRGRLVVAWIGWLAAAGTAWGASFEEDFATDPIATGRWTLPDGGADRFTYDPVARTLTAHYNSLLPTARLVRGFGLPATAAAKIEFTVDFEIRSEGFSADPYGFAQISFGFMNGPTTGPDRTSEQGSAFDTVAFDYFPNSGGFFRGPTLSPTVILSDFGGGFYGAIQFAWGSETLLDEEGESELPLDTRLSTRMTCFRAGGGGLATMQVLQGGNAITINGIGTGNPPGSGGPDGDPTTIQTSYGTGTFTVDSFALLLWRDTWAWTTPSIVADVVFHHIHVVARYLADLDDDNDVDVDDFVLFQGCFNGPNQPPPQAKGCATADFDGDGDVDLADFHQFGACFNGPNRAPACAG